MFSILAPYWGKIVFAGVIFGAGIGLGMHLEQPRIDKLNQTIGEDQTAIATLTAGIAEQNAGIVALRVEGEQRATAAKVALDTALHGVIMANKRAADILASRPPVGQNECAAAEEAFRAELLSERGVK